VLGASLRETGDLGTEDFLGSLKSEASGSLKLNSSARSTIIFEISGESVFLILGVDLLSFEFSFSTLGNSY
jgi:hypothetical protein